MIVVTGAAGHLGRHAIESLLARKIPAAQIAALVRNPQKAADLAARGVQIRQADYSRPETLGPAFAGADRVLFVSGSEVGRRIPQHRAVIDAARQAGARLIAYTSILRADRSTLALSDEHRATEELLRESGVPYVFLRNGWYVENYTGNLAPALEHGALFGCAGTGRIAAATRADYAAAAAEVITGAGHENRIYELGGDHPFTMAELAAEVSRQSGKTVVYRDVPPDEYQRVLVGAGLPESFARLLVDSDLGVARGELDDSSGELRRLLGRPTTTLADAVSAALRR